MTSKQRSYLKGLAMTMDAVLQIGKSSLTPEITKSVEEALNARELIKIHVLKNCADDGKDLAQILAERTHSVNSVTIAAIRDCLTSGLCAGKGGIR